MASGIVGLFGVLSVSIVILICMLILFKSRKAEPKTVVQPAAARPPVQKPSSVLPKPAEKTAVHSVAKPTEHAKEQMAAAASRPSTGVLKPAGAIDLEGTLMSTDNRNERILAGISENIRKSLESRPVTSHSPIVFSESRRSTEYVRVKREIITPHGHIRFSILKDWLSTNMLAVLRRASFEWKTPDDLIALIPTYLEANAEVLNNEILLIGTSGYNEKLAIPIQNFDASHLHECFDFVSAGRMATNTPAVLLPIEAGFEVISKGVITQPVLTGLDEHSPVLKVLPERSSATLQEAYSVALVRKV
jgi:hypothetical protein